MNFSLPDVERETIDELIVSIHEALDEIEPSLGELAENPDRMDILNDLFRNLHSVKGNFRMCFLEPFTDYVHEIEEAISEVRKGKMRFSGPLRDAVLIGLDKLRTNMDLLQSEGELDISDMQTYGDYFQRLAQGGDVSATDTEGVGVLDDSMKEELMYFRHYALKFDQRIKGRQGRTEKILKVINLMFQKCDGELFTQHTMVDRWQMQAAIYMHDIGISLHKELSNEAPVEESHAVVAFNYLKKFPCWQQAAEIVLQHHELLDGSGYPQQLTGDAIHPGAKLLAVAACFVDGVDDHQCVSERHAVVAAIKSVNSGAGSLYDADVVSLLPDIARQLYTQGQAEPAIK